MAGQKPLTPLAELLYALRTKHRYSIRKLADASGVSRNYISMIEHGYDKATGKPLKPHPNILKDLGHVLGDSYDALMLAAGYMPDEVAAGVLEEQDKDHVLERQELPPETIEELKDIIAEVTVQVLRKRGFIK